MAGAVVLEAARRVHLRNAGVLAGLVVVSLWIYPLTATSTYVMGSLARLLLPLLAPVVALGAMTELRFALLTRPVLHADAERITIEQTFRRVTLPRDEITGIGPPDPKWGDSLTIRTHGRTYRVNEAIAEERYAQLRAQLLELGYPAL